MSLYLSEMATHALAQLVAVKRARNPKASESDAVRDALVSAHAETFVAYQADVAARLTSLAALVAQQDRELASLRAVVGEEANRRDQAGRKVLETLQRALPGN